MERKFSSQQSSLLWHTISQERTFVELKSHHGGINEDEATKRLSLYGPNRLTPPQTRSAFTRFVLQFHNVLIYVLLGAGVLTAVLGHWIDSYVIIGVVFINAAIGFVQEGKAEKALDAIKNILSQQASIIRDGKRRTISADQLVLGDIVLLQSGDKVPADLRLFRVKELRIDEASLTGESLPVEKNTGAVPENATIGDRSCMAYSGALVTFGQGSGIVVATGDDTEIGRISQMLTKVPTLTTRLLVQMADFGEKLTLAITVIAIATFIFGVVARNYSFSEMFLACVGLAVAAIPEGLPAIVTITLAIGVQRMAKQRAIIRRLPAVESLGAVTVICSDKTGTLTRNEMTVQTITTATNAFEVKGTGYDPHGSFILNNKDFIPSEDPAFMELIKAGLLCNEAELNYANNLWSIEGDPTEGALVTLAQKAGFEPERERERYPRTDIIPFESEHKFMATLNHDHSGHSIIYLKGAPETVLLKCNKQMQHGEAKPIDLPYWHECIEKIAGNGYRLLAIACKAFEPEQQTLNSQHVEAGMTLLGIVGIIDPPREDAIQSIKMCKRAGIRVKMITGDHVGTARFIGAKMGIGDGKHAITGQEISEMDDAYLRQAVQEIDVFARVSPEHKLRLVQLLQANGEVVAMTGDGVNDAPALKRADVGIAMGLKGTEVAKESAEIVLTDDNFSSIAQAIKEGRTVYNNIKKAITFILPTNGGEAGIIIAAIMSGRLLPITPVQILWVNMITAVTLALSLAFEPAEKGVMSQPPRNPSEPIITYFLVWRILFVSLVLVIGTFGLFLWERNNGLDIAQARTIAVNTLVFFEIFYLFNTRSLQNPLRSFEDFFANRKILIAIAAVVFFQSFITYIPFMQNIFGTAAIRLSDWLRIIAITVSVFVLVEIEKNLLQRWERNKELIPDRPTVKF